ncbi:unnamed protein product [Chironomus riparius]|uniref:C2H2-type domain-containing protein n=1 Tax=Chironomus riparius TaxID=315576 RepID=A0A9N9RKJ6_9DIPT|nr:unnamed protein product [Chironomus riparius]
MAAVALKGFDTKSSPLALLAQTCSAIGSDATPNPKLLANIEKSNKMRDKVSTSPSGSLNGSSPSDFKSSFKPYESSVRDNDMPDDLRVASRLKAANVNAKVITSPHSNGIERCESTASTSSQHTRKSPPSASPKTTNEKSNSNSSSASLKSTTPTSAEAQQQKSHIDKDIAALRSLAAASPYTTMPYLNGYPYAPGPYANPMDLIAQHQSMLKAAALNPYLNYARMKAASSAADMMMGMCRDPYCTGCSLGSHMMAGKNGAGSACPPGCTCDHSMSKAMASNPAAAMAYHAQLAQLAAASQMPYVCNWVGTDSSYCGKRFSASDDLFQHLRAEHTGNAIPDALLNASSASTNSLLAAFPRTYPTPPLSPLSSARYHPYSKNPLLPPPGASSLAGLLPPHPSLAQYFSPYAALYPRMSSSNLQP